MPVWISWLARASRSSKPSWPARCCVSSPPVSSMCHPSNLTYSSTSSNIRSLARPSLRCATLSTSPTAEHHRTFSNPPVSLMCHHVNLTYSRTSPNIHSPARPSLQCATLSASPTAVHHHMCIHRLGERHHDSRPFAVSRQTVNPQVVQHP